MRTSVAFTAFGLLFTGSAGFAEKLSDRVLHKEIEVAASPQRLWQAWSTVDGWKSFIAAGGKIELEPGGAFEIYFSLDAPEGQRGAEGCTVLSFLPNEMIAFTWNAPPSIPRLRDAQVKTQVVVTFQPLSPGKTRVHLDQLGFGEGEDWEEYYKYFDKAWGHVLEAVAQKITSEPAKAPEPDKILQEGPVTVRAFAGPEKRQDFIVEIPAPIADVWHALTTPEGVRSFFPSNPVIELKPGGKWDLHGGKPNRVMAFVPNRMLAATGSAPDRFPMVQQGGHWGVFYFQPVNDNATRLRLSVVGWGDGEEWDRAFDYLLKANAQFLNMIHQRFAAGPRAASQP